MSDVIHAFNTVVGHHQRINDLNIEFRSILLSNWLNYQCVNIEYTVLNRYRWWVNAISVKDEKGSNQEPAAAEFLKMHLYILGKFYLTKLIIQWNMI